MPETTQPNPTENPPREVVIAAHKELVAAHHERVAKALAFVIEEINAEKDLYESGWTPAVAQTLANAQHLIGQLRPQPATPATPANQPPASN